MPATLRVLQDPPLDGPINMARDEALLNLVGDGRSPPTLRLYRWAAPAISLGYFQKYAEYESLPPPAGGLPVVRRLTGGGAILHDLELTYSITLPVDDPLVVGAPNRLYELAHDAIMAALGELGVDSARCGVSDDSGAGRGPFFCFERRHCFDVLLEGRKLAGSAQRRTLRAILQHGSIVLGNRYPQQPTAMMEKPYEQLPALVTYKIRDQFARVAGRSLVDGAWTKDELTAAAELLAKYAGTDWTRRT